MVSGVVVDMLKIMRYGSNNDTTRKHRCKVDIQAGASNPVGLLAKKFIVSTTEMSQFQEKNNEICKKR